MEISTEIIIICMDCKSTDVPHSIKKTKSGCLLEVGPCQNCVEDSDQCESCPFCGSERVENNICPECGSKINKPPASIQETKERS